MVKKMKVFIDCECEILTATLEKILVDCISSQNDAQLVICDKDIPSAKPLFIIGKDIAQPFSELELKQKLNEFLEQKTQKIVEKSVDFDAFEKHLDEILASFKKQILELFKNAK